MKEQPSISDSAKWILVQSYQDWQWTVPELCGPFQNLQAAKDAANVAIAASHSLVVWQYETPKNLWHGVMLRGFITEKERRRRWADCKWIGHVVPTCLVELMEAAKRFELQGESQKHQAVALV